MHLWHDVAARPTQEIKLAFKKLPGTTYVMRGVR